MNTLCCRRLLTLLLLGSSLTCFASANRLDGRTFSGELLQATTHKIDMGEERDNLVFADGKLRSEALERLGFHESEYSAKLTKRGLIFEATFEHDDGTRVFYKGTIHGLKVTAVSSLIRLGAETEEYRFTGVLTRGKHP